MCIFQSGKDIKPMVRLSLRTLQYLVIPLLSLALLVVGSMHMGDCQAQPMLPVWHVVAGASGLCTPIFYLLFDEVNPWMSSKMPNFSACLDNIVVFLSPLYIMFEIGWLITGSVWTFGTDGVEDPTQCDHTIYVFSFVVVMNFWIHILTPLIFMIVLCCTRLFPYCAYCAYWNVMKTAMDNWTRRTRMIICMVIALPLGVAMVIAGGLSVEKCDKEFATNNASSSLVAISQSTPESSSKAATTTSINDLTIKSTMAKTASLLSSPSLKMLQLELVHIPVWLIVAGCALLVVPIVYFIYDKYCKEEGAGPLIKNIANCLVILFLLCGLAWSLVGFVWVFGSHQNEACGASSFTYQFAFGTLIILNIIMDVWICFKICVVLHWAFLSED